MPPSVWVAVEAKSVTLKKKKKRKNQIMSFLKKDYGER